MFLDIQIPFNNFNINIVENILQFYGNDLQLSQTFHQEVKLWTKMWSTTRKANPKHSETICDIKMCLSMYPSIITIYHMLLIVSMTSCGVESAIQHYNSLKLIGGAP